MAEELRQLELDLRRGDRGTPPIIPTGLKVVLFVMVTTYYVFATWGWL